ncbi:MAG TPA: TolC family protein [Thermoanaerobaculia bacterium]|nr:TolC family protein [Thermoanaerobaculia bacterium]
MAERRPTLSDLEEAFVNRACAVFVRGPRAIARGLAVVLSAALLFPGALRAADAGVTVPLNTAARKAVPLPPGEKIELSLEQTIRLALENTLDLNVASLSYEKAAFGIGSAQGLFDPYVELDLSANRNQEPTYTRIQAQDTKVQNGNLIFGGLLASGASYNLTWANSRNDQFIAGYTLYNPTVRSSLTVGATQPLLKNFGSTVNTRFVVQANYGRDTSAWTFVSAVQTVVQLVENAYWDLVYARALLKSRQEALAIAKDLNRITQIKIDVGTLAPIDIVQTEVTVAQREQDIITAEGQIGDAEDRLRRILNVRTLPDWQRPIVTTDLPTMEPTAFSVEEGMKRALETRPEVRQNLIDIESKKLTLAFNQNQLKPQLDLSASYGYAGIGANYAGILPDGSEGQLGYGDAFSNLFNRDFPAWTVGLVFHLPIPNKTSKNNVAIASSDLELSRTNLVLLKQNLWLEVRTAARGVDTALRTIAAAKKARELAERNLDAEKKKFENGMSTTFQVSSIQNDLTNARATELQAYATYLKARVTWHKAIGDILEWKNVSLEGLPVSTAAIPAEEPPAK